LVFWGKSSINQVIFRRIIWLWIVSSSLHQNRIWVNRGMTSRKEERWRRSPSRRHRSYGFCSRSSSRRVCRLVTRRRRHARSEETLAGQLGPDVNDFLGVASHTKPKPGGTPSFIRESDIGGGGHQSDSYERTRDGEISPFHGLHHDNKNTGDDSPSPQW